MSGLVPHNLSQDYHLRWCFIYLVNFGGGNVNIDWLKNINLQEQNIWENLKPVFQNHGYHLKVTMQSLPLHTNLPLPVILKVKNLNYVVLHQITDDFLCIKSLDAQLIKIKRRDIETFFDPILIQVTYSPLFYEKPQLNRQIIRFVWKKCTQFRALCVVSIFVLFFYELFSLIDPLLLNIVVEHLDLFASKTDLWMTLVLLAGVTLVGLSIAYLRQRLWILIFGEFSSYLTQDLIWQVFNLPGSMSREMDANNRFTRLYGIDQVYYRFLQQVFFTAMDIVFISVHFVLMCVFQIWLAGIDLCFLVALFGVNVYFSRLYFSDSQRLLHLQNHSSQILFDGLDHADSIRRYQFQEQFFLRWRQAKKQDWNAFLKNDWMQSSMEFSVLFLKKINGFFMMSASIYLILKNTLSLGGFIAFWALKIQVFSRIELSFKRFLQWQYLKAPMTRISELFMNLSIKQKPIISQVEWSKSDGNEHLYFQILDLEVRGIQYQNLTFEFGKKYLIKGPSGCGKSSLFLAMAGGLDYSSGIIYYAGKKLSTDSWHQVYQDCAYVMQNEGLFRASVLDNICLFAEHINYGLLHEIFYLLDLNDLISELPQGMHTVLGDTGYHLSQGQIQRIFLARALYRQPKWLILDEATCHLDEDSEQILMQRLSSLSISMIVTNHRSGFESLFHEVLTWDQCLKVSD